MATPWLQRAQAIPADDVGDVGAEPRSPDARIIHCIGEKPWYAKTRRINYGYVQLERLWEDAFIRRSTNDELIHILGARREGLGRWLAKRGETAGTAPGTR